VVGNRALGPATQAEPITCYMGLGSHSIFSKPQLLPKVRSAARTPTNSSCRMARGKGRDENRWSSAYLGLLAPNPTGGRIECKPRNGVNVHRLHVSVSAAIIPKAFANLISFVPDCSPLICRREIFGSRRKK
jgi:hypothetical protein